MASKIQLRRDTAANWTSVNPTLSQGELGYETDTDKVKVGDGATAWTSLSYLIDGTAGAGGIALTDISVGTPLPASGGGELNYDNTTGVFTYTPAAVPDFSTISVTVDDSDLTSLAASVEDLIAQLQGL